HRDAGVDSLEEVVVEADLLDLATEVDPPDHGGEQTLRRHRLRDSILLRVLELAGLQFVLVHLFEAESQLKPESGVRFTTVAEPRRDGGRRWHSRCGHPRWRNRIVARPGNRIGARARSRNAASRGNRIGARARSRNAASR